MITAALFNYIVLSWIGIAIIIFFVLLKISAPYGRHSKTSWGPMIDNRLGWFLMEFPALGVFLFFILQGNALKSIPIIIFASLWILHYFNRVFIFPLRTKTRGKKMPVVIMLFAVCFNFVNGFINGYWFSHLSPEYSITWLYDPRFIIGIMLFVVGMFINQYHDKILLKLRNKTSKGYSIPRGGLFRFVSCPNFFGEIVEWGGYALLTWCLPTFSFFVWSFANLVPRALDHHKWYKSNFDDYPKERKAVIPKVL